MYAPVYFCVRVCACIQADSLSVCVMLSLNILPLAASCLLRVAQTQDKAIEQLESQIAAKASRKDAPASKEQEKRDPQQKWEANFIREPGAKQLTGTFCSTIQLATLGQQCDVEKLIRQYVKYFLTCTNGCSETVISSNPKNMIKKAASDPKCFANGQ